jgi:putative peptidoglycan lipid II flippase
MMLGLAITQINTFVDSLFAWGLSSYGGSDETISWLGGRLSYPMRQGAAAAVYYGEQVYQLPLGLLGIAVAMAIFPLLSRHAARGDRESLGGDLTLALRLVVFLGLPASAGLVLLARPLAQLLFEHGQFNAQDAARTARMIAAYSAGVLAYCALPVVVRGYYAIGDRVTPARIGLLVVLLNFMLNLALVWPFAEAGLAAATAIAATVHVLVLVAIFSRRRSHVAWKPVSATICRTLVATAVMTAAAGATLAAMPSDDELAYQIIRVVAPMAAGVLAYFAAYAALAAGEIRELWTGHDAVN